MRIFRSGAELQAFALQSRREGKTIGLVPTMGYLHAGHASLIDIARKECDLVIVSDFVNPTQFAPTEDLDSYPRDFEHDVQLCTEHGADAIYAPTPDEMYEKDASTWVTETFVSKDLCGASRPIHFRGVATVVTKLFHLALPDVAVFGEKDAQQLFVIRRMVRDLNFPIRIIGAPLVRDVDGVAMSSRNRYLSEDERIRARALSQSLFAARRVLAVQGLAALPVVLKTMRCTIEAAGGKIDYIEPKDTATFAEPTEKTKELLLACAVYFGTTRLLDNQIIAF